MDPDQADGRRVVAKAAYLARELRNREALFQGSRSQGLVGIPFFALSRAVLMDPGVFTTTPTAQLSSLDRRIADEFEIHAPSLGYYFGTATAFYHEGDAKLKMYANCELLATASKGRTIFFAYSLSLDAAALTLLDLNSDTAVPFDRLLAVDRQSLRAFDSLVLLIDKGDVLNAQYDHVIRLIKETSPAQCHPTPLTNLAGFCLELFSGKGLESALLEGIGLKHETVSCHYGAVFPKTPMATRTVPWLHGVRLPPPGHLLNGHGDGHSVPSRSLVRCVSFSLPKSGNKPNKPHASMVAGKGFAGHCSPSS